MSSIDAMKPEACFAEMISAHYQRGMYAAMIACQTLSRLRMNSEIIEIP